MKKTTFLLLALSGMLPLAAGQQMFVDESFESVRKKEQNPYWWRLTSEKEAVAKADFKDKVHGRAALRISGVSKSAAVRYIRYFKTAPGIRWRISVWAKGKGTLNLLCRQNAVNLESSGVRKLRDFLSPGVKLTEKWQKYEFFYTGDAPGLEEFNPCFKLRGPGGEMLLDNAACFRAAVPGKVLLSRPLNAVTAPGEMVAYRIDSDGSRVEGTFKDGSKVELQNGLLKFKAPLKTGVHAVTLTDAGKHAGRNFYINVLSMQDFKHLEKITSGVKNPGRVLVLGDSLSDYLRGRNWVDMAENFCCRRFGDKTVFFNYGVGGDMVTRTLARMKKVPRTYALERYQGIDECRPDTVIIFLGHNDSLLLDRDLGSKSPTQVSPEKFIAAYTELIKLVRQKYNSPRIILMTPVCMDYAKTWKHRFGNPKLVFGEPAILEKYRSMVLKIARDNKCEAIDLFAVFKAQKDLGSFSLRDGIHVNLKGSRLVAETLLKHLGK